MKVKINGDIVEICENLSVYDYLVKNGFEILKVAVEKDGEILPKNLWKNTPIKSGKSYEIVEFVGGG
ncbi:thiamine biosynthesis protein [Campylobacter blaseri]|uniref:Thiamine biosynthesis protein ThiS n=1 Tax=Campylobacter blaseri TaxID=2042961 RepID=A0A2P8QZ26_9BACT|nr:sulfur carrier protein ThiS [Campylobacter blaseri]PSM51498.1 thiamine biosynthesis protein ThiS [Campylobacter blaseri]PSM52947.1 thiamine biosynthesis protein ThiS [Campylobacter blaseri]QKF86491.1 thiamine biosynthesis protein [Campylobacter blaseri]